MGSSQKRIKKWKKIQVQDRVCVCAVYANAAYRRNQDGESREIGLITFC